MQISQLQNEINSFKNVPQPVAVGVSPEELQNFESRIEAIEKQNLNVIDSKADVATVLGLVTRLDKAEENLFFGVVSYLEEKAYPCGLK